MRSIAADTAAKAPGEGSVRMRSIAADAAAKAAALRHAYSLDRDLPLIEDGMRGRSP
jgi:hypothetical protein